ncbi:calmodulin-like membrane associated Ca(2+)-binding protein [Rhodopirellula baltica SH28]|uniref:Calmodulin-like membrane associated Ca(2+)-binding protein n=1 Tax=Rhodopirellula baltica SH28 TaxID=993517 RepID=K5D0A8_RHOBT|nr:proprotein convertase P-domain-containing protein [Rhodopirellula baltica]EKJ99891.1 calmodulin-like membrane associated Ca(2+)-binding protein [Rhodopirellula baltica SH28]
MMRFHWNAAMSSSLIKSLRRTVLRAALPVSMAAIGVTVVSDGNVAQAQSGLRESLERLDRDQDGDIEPEEITALARPYLERVAEARRMDLNRDNSVERWQEAARIYHALQNGVAGREVDPEADVTVLPFGPRDDEPMVPEFGLGEMKFQYTISDYRQAERTMSRSDRNGDGFLDRREVERADWKFRDPFEEDYDKDNRLSTVELAQRYARRRLLSGASRELVQKNRRVGSEVRRNESSDREDDSRYWRRDRRYYLASTVMERFDKNRNGRLEASETVAMGIPFGRIDLDRDGEISRDELNDHLLQVQEREDQDAEGLPPWFFERDEDGDQQISMPEFTSEWTPELLAEFESYDQNADGLLTKSELAGSTSLMGGNYRNETASALPPRKTVVSEIFIEEEYLIADVDVQLSITHTHDEALDAYLVGPDETKIELFSGVGGHDDHFDRTRFDDDARLPITKARPPFEGTFIPEGRLKNQPSLSSFNGKNVQGTWQLIIVGTRSERFGLLHNWSLDITPDTSKP